MKRRQFFEFEDQPWFPETIRNYMTDYLKFVVDWFDFYQPVIPVIKKGLLQSGESTIIDLASGAGGGLLKVANHLKLEFPSLRIVLTDRYPNYAAFSEIVAQNPDVFSFEPKSVNARTVPPELKGLRTQFLSFHHFGPSDAQKILQNAVDAGQPIAVFEFQKRNWQHLLKFTFSAFAVLILTPLIRPFSWKRLLFTYLIPAVPLFIFWDGMVSVFRTYSRQEMRAMTARLESEQPYVWEVGESKYQSVTVVHLLGCPSPSTS